MIRALYKNSESAIRSTISAIGASEPAQLLNVREKRFVSQLERIERPWPRPIHDVVLAKAEAEKANRAKTNFLAAAATTCASLFSR